MMRHPSDVDSSQAGDSHDSSGVLEALGEDPQACAPGSSPSAGIGVSSDADPWRSSTPGCHGESELPSHPPRSGLTFHTLTAGNWLSRKSAWKCTYGLTVRNPTTNPGNGRQADMAEGGGSVSDVDVGAAQICFVDELLLERARWTTVNNRVVTSRRESPARSSSAPGTWRWAGVVGSGGGTAACRPAGRRTCLRCGRGGGRGCGRGRGAYRTLHYARSIPYGTKQRRFSACTFRIGGRT